MALDKVHASMMGDITAQNIGFIAGQVSFFAQASAPAGFLKCNGAAISRTTYSVLFAAIGTLYGVGNGTTTFNLPDLRGEFLRSWDDARGIDSGRAIATAQAAAFASHNHTGTNGFANTWYIAGAAGGAHATAAGSNSTVNGTDATGGAETRPRNVALLACIFTGA